MNTLYSPQFSRTWLGGNVYVPVYCERTLFSKWPAQATTAILTAGSELRTLQLLQRTTWPQNPKKRARRRDAIRNFKDIRWDDSSQVI